ncbi:hypothetical protein A9R05_39100 (plasmid) [Burkholderia sp. KK1]|nr:hypothetical protein A9R05_39100 [Burkholderia sp. KK1]
MTVALSDTGAQIYGDLTRLTQAFSNLLNNALTDTAVGGEIHVRRTRVQDMSPFPFTTTALALAMT